MVFLRVAASSNKDDKKIAVSTFALNTPIGVLLEFAGNAASEISKKYVNNVYMIVFGSDEKEDIEKEINEHLSTLKDELASNIHTIFSNYDDVDKSISELNL